MSIKNIRRIDVNLFSGSSDTLRSELGLYYHVTSSDALDGDFIQLNEMVSTIPTTRFEVYNDVDAFSTLSERIIVVQTNPDLITTASANIPTANTRIPIRIIGTEDVISDEMWKTMLLGGTYGEEEYKPIFTSATYDDYSFDYQEPYSLMESKLLAKESVMINSFADLKHYDIGYQYNTYLPEYETKASKMRELLLPNIYMLTMVDDSENPEEEFPPYMRNFVSVEGLSPDIISGVTASSLFDIRLLEYPPPRSTQAMEEDTITPGTYLYEDRNINLREYLTGAYAVGEYSAETTSKISQKTSTLYYDSQFLGEHAQGIWTNREKIPFYNRLSFPIQDLPAESPYSDIISDYGLQEEFLMYLKNTDFGSRTQNYIKESTFIATSDMVAHDKITSENSSNPRVDYLSMLYSLYSSAQSQAQENGTIMGKDTLDRIAAKNPESKYRYYKTISAMKAIEQATSIINNASASSTEITHADLNNLLIKLHDGNGSTETVAYRVEKIGGTLTGPERTVNSIQNMYFINDKAGTLKGDGSNFVYADTQVKVGQEYMYSIYAYVIVPGYQYRYSDLRVSRNIGRVLHETSPGVFDVTDQPEDHCIEFYNPATGIASEQLLNDSTNLKGNTYSARYSDEALAAFDEAIDPTKGNLTIGEILPASYQYNLGAMTAADSLAQSILPNSSQGAYEWIFSMPESIRQDVKNSLFENWALLTRNYETSDGKTVLLVDQNDNRYATNSQIKSENRYLADFYMDFMANVKIIEVPVATKVVSVMDNPPVAPDVTPYQRKDESQIIGFYVNVESFRLPLDAENTETLSTIGTYPTPLNSAEATKKTRYLSSNNMFSDQLVENNSISKPSMLEVYRLDRLPESLTEFDGNLVYSKPLAMPHDPAHKYTNCFYEEKIRTNKKYYYLLRFLNEHGDAGYIAPIQVVELIDDGGYKYTVFDVINETDLYVPEEKQDSTVFKKLMQVTPTTNHTIFDTSDLDYSEPASSQVDKLIGKVGNAENLIWGKTFKFRITSKKTGKKVDLNIKYNLRDS